MSRETIVEESYAQAHVRRCREVWQEGRYVPPPPSFEGRVLAVMRVAYEDGRKWHVELEEEDLLRYDAVLLAYEKKNPDADVLWWPEFQERNGWR